MANLAGELIALEDPLPETSLGNFHEGETMQLGATTTLNIYIMQAISSSSGLVVKWVFQGSTPDFTASAFPGPGSAVAGTISAADNRGNAN